MGARDAAVFTESVLAAARSSPRASEFLVCRLALAHGTYGEGVRKQVESAAALVPEQQRGRVVSPLHCDDRDKALAALNMLLLAKTLHDLGWSVEYEPVVLDGTPDLRIRRNAADFVVEVRQVIGDARLPNEREIERVYHALRGIRTRTPLALDAVSVSPAAPLGRFRKFVEETLVRRPRGQLVFRDEGVLITFELLPELDAPIGAIAMHSGPAQWIDDRPDAEAAVQEKLKRYKCPLVIALDMVDCFDPFQTAEAVMCGSEVIRIPINMATGVAAGEPQSARSANAIVLGRDRDAARARGRLQALLPFEVRRSRHGVSIHARVLSNPYRVESELPEFEPIPVLTITGQDERSLTMEYVRGGAVLSSDERDRWEHIP